MRAATNLGRVTTVKDAAYAWRQAIFFLSLLPVAELGERLESFRRLPLASQWPMTEVIEGLASVVAGLVLALPALRVRDRERRVVRVFWRARCATGEFSTFRDLRVARRHARNWTDTTTKISRVTVRRKVKA